MSNCTKENSPKPYYVNYNKIKLSIFILNESVWSFFLCGDYVIPHGVYLLLDDNFLPLQGTPIPMITRAVLGFSGSRF